MDSREPDRARDAFTPDDRATRIDSESDAYWRNHFATRDYYDQNYAYEDYEPAYHYGAWARAQFVDEAWTPDLDEKLGRSWQERKGPSRLGWNQARHAARDAWERSHRR
ncbi:MAG: hypothetical protein ACRD2J_12875 [Thermoanaerobaculia bacterium]